MSNILDDTRIDVISRTQRIEVVSRTQRIVVDPATSSVMVVNAGPPGPPGIGVDGSNSTESGEFLTPTTLMIIDHTQNFRLVDVKFYTLDEEDELEPEDIVYLTDNRILATWPEPTVARWTIS